MLSRIETWLATHFMRKPDCLLYIEMVSVRTQSVSIDEHISFAYSCLQIDFEWISTLQKYSLLRSN